MIDFSSEKYSGSTGHRNSFPAIALSCIGQWLEHSVYNPGVESSSPIIDMNVIVETIPELCGNEDQLKEMEGYIEEIKSTLLFKDFVYDIRENISIKETSFE